jgi:hypothetical protein
VKASFAPAPKVAPNTTKGIPAATAKPTPPSQPQEASKKRLREPEPTVC